MKKALYTFFLLFLSSCSNVEEVNSENKEFTNNDSVSLIVDSLNIINKRLDLIEEEIGIIENKITLLSENDDANLNESIDKNLSFLNKDISTAYNNVGIKVSNDDSYSSYREPKNVIELKDLLKKQKELNDLEMSDDISEINENGE